MGVMIYPSMELTTDKKLDDKQRLMINMIRDNYNSRAFVCNEADEIVLYGEEIEGFDPIEDGIKNPLEKLLNLAKEYDFKLNGYVEIKSDYRDYDNVLIQVSDNQMKEENLEISNASTQQLLDELVKRNVLTHEEAETFLSRDTEFERD